MPKQAEATPFSDGDVAELTAGEPATKRGRARRTKIINAAIRLIWRDGYASVGVDAILREAATQKGSFYYFFPSKSELLIACLDQLWAVQRQQVQHILTTAPSGRAALTMQLIWLSESQRTAHRKYGYVPGLFHMSIGVPAPSLEDRIREKIKNYADEYNSMILASLERIAVEEGLGADPKMLTNIIGSTIGGTILKARMENDIDLVIDLPRIITQLVDHFSLRA